MSTQVEKKSPETRKTAQKAIQLDVAMSEYQGCMSSATKNLAGTEFREDSDSVLFLSII